MRYFIQAITLTALIYLLLLLYFQYDYFFKFIPVILLLQFISLFFIHKISKKALYYIANIIIFMILSFYYCFGLFLAQ
jgi:uncharacterized membrane protein